MSEADDDLHDSHAAPLVLTCDTRSAALTSWLFSILIGGIAGYGAFSMLRYEQNWARDWPIVGFFVFICPGAALLLVAASVWATLRWRKQGTTRLRIPSGYVAEGGKLVGMVECSRTLELVAPAHADLECTESRTVRSGSKSKTVTRKVWSGQFPIEPEQPRITARNRSAADAGTCFALKIPIPEIRRVADGAASDSGVASESAWLRWKLTIVAPLRGMDHESCFDVPVLSKTDLADGEHPDSDDE